MERFEAWWAEKQSISFRSAYADAPELHGGECEKRWGSSYKAKERVAFLAGASDHDSALASAVKERDEAYARVEVMRRHLTRVIGDHWAPNDCYSTGPLTGDPFVDLVECPSCAALEFLKSLAPELAKEPS